MTEPETLRDIFTEFDWDLALEVCTPRQLQVLAWYRQGYGYRTIGGMFGIAPWTVRDRVKRAAERLRAAELERAA